MEFARVLQKAINFFGEVGGLGGEEERGGALRLISDRVIPFFDARDFY